MLSKSQKENILSAIIHIQYVWRWKKTQSNKADRLGQLVYHTLLQLMYKIGHQFHSNVFNQEQYNRLMHQLEKFSNDYKKLVSRDKCVIRYSLQFKTQLLDFIQKLRDITINIGLELEYLLPLFDNNSELQSYRVLKPLHRFYHHFFVPTSCHRFNRKKEGSFTIDTRIHTQLDNTFKDSKKPVPTSLLSKKKKILSKNDEDKTDKSKQHSSKFQDDYNTLKTHEQESSNKDLPFCVHYKHNNQSLIETINGARVYYYLDQDHVLVMNGYFREDPLNLSRMTGSFKTKQNNLTNHLKKLTTINSYFKNAFMTQISVRDFLINSVEDLANMCIKSFKDLQRLKQKTISSLVKEFLAASLDQQRQILTLFLLTEGDTDTQYLAYLMFDMISNESYLLKPQPIAEQVYSSLHWSVQKLFKIALQSVNKYTNRLLNFNEDDIPYEKRICLLKAPDTVKAKAMEKYKEVSQKTNESASKAQQYLDGILRIPFGIYNKESILCYLSEFNSRFQVILEGSSNTNNSNNHPGLVALCQKYNNYPRVTSNIIDKFFEQLESLEGDKNSGPKIKISKHRDAVKIIQQLKSRANLKKLMYIESSITKSSKSGESESDKSGESVDRVVTITASRKQNGIKSNVDIGILEEQLNIFIQQKPTLLQFVDESFLTSTSKESNSIPVDVLSKYQNLKGEWDSYLVRKQQYLLQSRNYLDQAVHGHKEAKNQLERIIAQWMNGDMNGYCFGFEGPPGTGKTSLAKKGLTRCLQDDDGQYRPFSFIAIGGSSNGATLEGHSYTYVGSTWGRIVDILMETRCMNPIIFIDELDKVSHTEHGKEIIGILTHLTDSTQNDEFCDKYFSGVKLDLSKVLFIFSYNDPEKIDPILLDRIHRVQFKPLKKKDKIIIAHRYILPEIFRTVGFRSGVQDEGLDIIFSDEVLEFIIDNYTFEAGARKFREKLFEIVREINLRWLMGSKIRDRDISFPFSVTIDFLTQDIFSDRHKIHVKKISNYPRIGLVNGLYATATGIGGLTIIESFRVPTNDRLGLELTGKQGDVMKESMKVAKTVAWNMLPSEVKVQINQQWNRTGNFGMHIHCPEGATPKDGPSAGAAITVAIISLLANLPVNNLVAMTGEIDLNGSIHPIGGLETKLDGAKKAGVKIALCPLLNNDDLDRIKRDDPELINSQFKVVTVSNIWEVIPYVFPNAPYNFINYTVKSGVIVPEYLSETEIELDGSRIIGDTESEVYWQQKSGPSLSIISQPTRPKTIVKGLTVGKYDFQLLVGDSPHDVSVSIPDSPEAKITTDSIWKGEFGWLDGGNSEGDLKKYHWNLISSTVNNGKDSSKSKSKNKISIDNPDEVRSRVSNLTPGVYIFELEVHDKFFRSHKTRCQVSVVEISKQVI